mgnify:CR=1 FL=1
MLEMYKNLTSSNNNNLIYTNEEIYEYIKFVNITCIDVVHYKHIIKYINKDNILFFDSLFDNYDILYEVLPLLSYDTVVNYKRFEDQKIKDRWIINNMTWIKRYKTELLEPYIKIEVDDNKYYVINGNIYDNAKKISSIVRDTLEILYDLPEISRKGHLGLIKYIINKIEKPLLNNLFTVYNMFQPITFLYDAILRACAYNHLEIVEYMINYLKSKNVLHLLIEYDYLPPSLWLSSSIKNIDIVKYLMENEDLKQYINIQTEVDVDEELIDSVGDGNMQMVDLMLSYGGNINYSTKINNNLRCVLKKPQYKDVVDDIDLLTIATCNEDLEMVEYLINKGICLEDFGDKSIVTASKNININVTVKYVIDKYISLINNDMKKKLCFMNILLLTGNKYIVAYVNDKYLTINDIIHKAEDINEILSSAYIGGQIGFIEKISNKKEYLSFERLIPIIYHNSEDDCINFLRKNNIHPESVNIITNFCIGKGYLNLLLFILNGQYEKVNIGECILNSYSEDECIIFIDTIYESKNITENEIVKMVESSVKKGYLKLITRVYKDKSIKLPLNDLLIEVCSNDNFEIIKYLVELGADVNYRRPVPIFNLYVRQADLTGSENSDDIISTVLQKCKNIEIIKYMINDGLSVKNIIKFMYTRTVKCEEKIHEDVIRHIYDNNLEGINTIGTHSLFNISCLHNRSDVVKYFLEKGINVKSSINSVFKEVIRCNRVEIAEVLLNNNEL